MAETSHETGGYATFVEVYNFLASFFFNTHILFTFFFLLVAVVAMVITMVAAITKAVVLCKSPIAISIN